MSLSLVNIGFGNMISAGRVVAIVNPEAAPIKRLIQDARERGSLIDAMEGESSADGVSNVMQLIHQYALA